MDRVLYFKKEHENWWEPDPSDRALKSMRADYARAHSGLGLVKIQAYRGQQAVPLENVKIAITKRINGETFFFFEGVTDESGIIDDIPLPAPPAEQSLDQNNPGRGAEYQLTASYPGFPTKNYTIEVFEGIKAIVPIQF